MNALAPSMTIGILLVTGMGVALLGSIKLALARKLNIDEARIGGMVSAFGFTIIPMVLLFGFLSDHFGQKAVIIGGSVTMALGLLIMARCQSYAGALLAVLVLGTAWSALVNAVNAIVPPTFGGSMVYATNLSNVFFGLGAFLTPMGLTFLLRRWSLPVLLSGLAGVVVIPAILAFTVDFALLFAQETATILAEPSEMGAWALLYNPVVWLCSIAFLFYAPLEASMGAWATTFLGLRGVSEGTALRWLSAFWLSFMLTRLLAALSLPEGGEAMAVLVLSIVAVGAMAAVVWSRNRGSAVATVAGSGFVFGAIFPTILALLMASVTLPVRGRAIGLFFAIGAVGWTLIPPMIGSLAQKTDIQRGFLIAVGSASALAIVALLLVLQMGS